MEWTLKLLIGFFFGVIVVAVVGLRWHDDGEEEEETNQMTIHILEQIYL